MGRFRQTSRRVETGVFGLMVSRQYNINIARSMCAIGWSMFQGQRTKIRTYGRGKKIRENSQSGSEKLRGFRNPKDSS